MQAEVDTLHAQLHSTAAELDHTEAAVLAFKQAHRNSLPESATTLTSQLMELTVQERVAQAQLERAKADVEIARKRLDVSAKSTGAKIRHATPYEQDIAQTRQALAADRASGKGNAHPDVVSKLEKLELLIRLRDDALEKGSSSVDKETEVFQAEAKAQLDEAIARRDVAGKELARVKASLESLQERVGKLPQAEATYAELTRSYAATKARHADLLDKLGRSRTQLDLERAAAHARIDLVEPPTVSSPKLLQTVAVRAGALGFMGLMLAIAIGMLRALRRLLAAREAAL